MKEGESHNATDLDKGIGSLEKVMHDTDEKFIRYRDSALIKFHFLFTLLVTFGLVATLYGFERVIDQVPVLVDNPYILLGTGILILLLTGTLFKKLS